MAQHLTLVALVVPDYESALAFYVGLLGFELVEDTAQGPPKRWVVVRPPGACETGVLLARAEGAAQHDAIGCQTGGRVGFFLQTDDFERDYAAMRAKGVVFEEAPRDEVYGRVVVWQDPFGNRWDLLERR